jgi:hypothetical protein
LTHDGYEEGRWQEAIIFNATTDSVRPFLGFAEIELNGSGRVRQAATFSGSAAYRVEWYRPNPHQGESRPDLSILANGVRLVNVESKNWKTNYKPFSAKMFNTHVLSRFQDLPADRNYVVISEWRVEQSCAKQISELMARSRIECLLTHRKTTSDSDMVSEKKIVELLAPILQQVLMANGEELIVNYW